MKMLDIAKNVLVLIFSMVTPEVAKKAIDAALDAVEDAVAKSDNKIDDALVLPLITKIREILGVPDTGEFADEPPAAEDEPVE